MRQQKEKEIINKNKDFLEQLKYVEMEIESLKSAINKLQTDCSISSTTAFSDIRVQTSEKLSIVEREVLKTQERRERMEKKLRSLYKLKDDIYEAIDGIEDFKSRCCIKCLYIDGLTIEECARTIGYCERHITRIRDLALLRMQLPQ